MTNPTPGQHPAPLELVMPGGRRAITIPGNAHPEVYAAGETLQHWLVEWTTRDHARQLERDAIAARRRELEQEQLTAILAGDEAPNFVGEAAELDLRRRAADSRVQPAALSCEGLYRALLAVIDKHSADETPERGATGPDEGVS